MADNYEVFTYAEVAIWLQWLQTLSTISKCQPLYWCHVVRWKIRAKTRRGLAVDEEMNQGLIWLSRKTEDWLYIGLTLESHNGG